MPPALKTHLEDEALAHRRSLNAEVLDRLMAPPVKRYTRTQQQYDALMALEPKPGDPRTDMEIALQMAEIMGDRITPPKPDDQFEDVEVDWLPGTQGDLWNQAACRVVSEEMPTNDHTASPT